MIHEVLKLTRPLILFDTETTGTNTREDRILELGFQVWESTGMTKSWRSLHQSTRADPSSGGKGAWH